jgi:hypothetical protein
MAMGAATIKTLKTVRKSGDNELSDNQIKFLEENYPKEYDAAYRAFESKVAKPTAARDKDNNPVTVVKKPAGKPAAVAAAAAKEKKAVSVRKPKEDPVIGQRDATEIGEEAARKAGKGMPNVKPKARGAGATAGATSRKPKAVSKPTTAPKPTAAPKPKSKSLAVTGAAGKKERGSGARTQQVAKAKELNKGSKVVSGGAGRRQRRITRAEAALAGAGVGLAAGVASQKTKKAETPAKSTPTKPKARSGNVGRTQMGDFVTKAKVAPKPKKNYGESGMGMKAYQNLNFSRRK